MATGAFVLFSVAVLPEQANNLGNVSVTPNNISSILCKTVGS